MSYFQSSLDPQLRIHNTGLNADPTSGLVYTKRGVPNAYPKAPNFEKNVHSTGMMLIPEAERNTGISKNRCKTTDCIFLAVISNFLVKTSGFLAIFHL